MRKLLVLLAVLIAFAVPVAGASAAPLSQHQVLTLTAANNSEMVPSVNNVVVSSSSDQATTSMNMLDGRSLSGSYAAYMVTDDRNLSVNAFDFVQPSGLATCGGSPNSLLASNYNSANETFPSTASINGNEWTWATQVEQVPVSTFSSSTGRLWTISYGFDTAYLTFGSAEEGVVPEHVISQGITQGVQRSARNLQINGRKAAMPVWVGSPQR